MSLQFVLDILFLHFKYFLIGLFQVPSSLTPKDVGVSITILEAVIQRPVVLTIGADLQEEPEQYSKLIYCTTLYLSQYLHSLTFQHQ